MTDIVGYNIDPNAPVGIAPRITSQTPRTRLVDAAIKSIPVVRPIIGREMDKEIVVCSIESFMKSYLPFVASANALEAVKDILKQKNLITENPLRFTEFPKRSTQTEWGTSEARAFGPLEDIAKAIGQYRFPENIPPRNNYNYRICGTTTITLEIEGSTHKNDACFTSDSPDQKTLAETDMAVPMEFKLKGIERVKNNNQVVSRNVQIMNEDIRRMFTFGIIIEADLVTLWYHSRSHSAATEQFSFVEKPNLLIQVFIVFMFGTPEQLGYDPNVTLEHEGHYVFTFPSKQGDSLNTTARRFRTVDTIADYRPTNITGSMTRIFLVEELDTGLPKAPQFVLKDVWLEKDAHTERELQTAIFQDIKDFWEGNSLASDDESLEAFKTLNANLVDYEGYKKYFLEIVADYSGRTSKPKVHGSTPTRGLLDDRYINPTRPITPLRSKFQTPDSLPRGTHNSVYVEPTSSIQEAPEPPPRDYLQKKQYRVVFKEFCTPVGDLGTLGEVVDVLQQLLTPLQLFLCARWVHRDISSGNILAYGSAASGWQVKLSDLEYAKKFPPPPGYVPAADPKTGTPFFMAHEMLTHYQIYDDQAKVPITNTPASKPVVNLGDPDEYAPSKKRSLDVAKPLAIHNFQHDLESIWWLLLWTMTCRVKHAPSQLWASTIFHNSSQISRDRRDCFLVDIEQTLRLKLEDSVKILAKPMNFLRHDMRFAFEERQTQGCVDKVGAYAVIHAKFYNFFSSLRRNYGTAWCDISLGDGRIDVAADTNSAPRPVSPATNAPADGPVGNESTTADQVAAWDDQNATRTSKLPVTDDTAASAISPAQAPSPAPVLSPARLPKRHFEDSNDSDDSESDIEVAEPSKIQTNLMSKLMSVPGPSSSKRQKR